MLSKLHYSIRIVFTFVRVWNSLRKGKLSDFFVPDHVALRYDTFSSLLGEGKPFVGIANSYLQSGHTVLLLLTLLCGFVDLPGFPLTQLPYDIREFLKVRAGASTHQSRTPSMHHTFVTLDCVSPRLNRMGRSNAQPSSHGDVQRFA